MKKLMIVAAVALSAAFANAAAVDWNLQSGKNLTTYVFNGDYTAQLTTALGNTETGGTAAFNAFIATLTADVNYQTATTGNRGANGGFAGVTAGDNLTFLVFDSTIEDGKTYRYGKVSTAGFIYYPPPEGQQSSPGKVTFAYPTDGSSGTIAAQDVPEPTSGLLLVLGLAGLALRRRRA